jgi:hypothetical protein
MGTQVILSVIALVLFIVAAFGWQPRGIHLGWVGAAVLTLSFLIP